MSLHRIGFNSLVARTVASTEGLVRVIEVSRASCKVHDGSVVHAARALPAFEQQAVVGDWAITTRDAQGALWLAERIAPYTQLTRIGPSGERQALVANVDFALLVMGLDGDFNLRRLERYIALAKSSGVTPVSVLTKSDLCADVDVDARLDEFASRLPGDLERYAVNATDASSLGCLAHHLGPGSTGVLLGSSGAGKSTLTNTLLGEQVQQTGAVRESDSRGRHTTTTRQLHLLPGGACLIDTPGLRGLRLDMAEERLDDAFADIGTLAAECRFRDCRHEQEPGCAVRAAVAPDRLANYQKLRREIARATATAVERERARGRTKSLQRALRAVVRRKRNPQD